MLYQGNSCFSPPKGPLAPFASISIKNPALRKKWHWKLWDLSQNYCSFSHRNEIFITSCAMSSNMKILISSVLSLFTILGCSLTHGFVEIRKNIIPSPHIFPSSLLLSKFWKLILMIFFTNGKFHFSHEFPTSRKLPSMCAQMKPQRNSM